MDVVYTSFSMKMRRDEWVFWHGASSVWVVGGSGLKSHSLILAWYTVYATFTSSIVETNSNTAKAQTLGICLCIHT